MSTRRALLAAGLAGLAAGSGVARARNPAFPPFPPFPQRPVRLVVPYSVGVGPDVVARSLAEVLSQQWQHRVWVDNKPGASGIVAFSEVRRTAPDGHTLFLGDTATLAVNPLLHSRLPYDPERDLLPLTLLFRATFLLWVGGSSRWRSLAELLAAARQAPGALSYGTLGNGHASHVALETFARAADLRFLHVPFKDAPSLFTAVANGDVDLTAFGLNSVAGLMAAGRLRPLAVAAREQLPGHADIPTLTQAGGPAVQMHPWAALLAVAGTPTPVLATLHHDLATALAHPELRSRATQAGFEITPSTPQALHERIQADVALYAPLISEGRLTPM